VKFRVIKSMSEEKSDLEKFKSQYSEALFSAASKMGLSTGFYEEVVDNLTALVEEHGFGKSEDFLNALRRDYGRSPLEQALDDALDIVMEQKLREE